MKLSDDEFCKVLEGAVAGKHENLKALMQLYIPLFSGYSTQNWVLDEDLSQY